MHSGASIFCLRCGHENPAHNRFCGMCGGELLRPHSPEPAEQNYSDPAALDDDPQPTVPFEHYSTGPSYLFDDEEPHTHWKLYLLAAVIAMAGFVIAYQWGKPNFDTSRVLDVFDKLDNRKQADTSSVPPAGTSEDNRSDNPAPVSSPANTPGATSAPVAAQPRPEPPAVADSAPAPANGGGNAAASVAPRGPSERDLAPGVVPPPVSPPAAAPSPSASPARTSALASPDAADEPPPADTANTAKPPERRAAAPTGKPEDTPQEPAPNQQLAERRQHAADDLLIDTAQNYLYGRGVPRDCDRALSYLRRAADTSVRAKTQLGALYATGQCVPQDRPTAYHWLALAFRGDPRNSYLERDLQMLWTQMTGDEKQRATRMTR